ncbi:MAG: hypothetical protein ACERKZ_05515 [Lachnotalea sp.]
MKSELEELSKKCMVAHKQAFETWEEGEIKEYWLENNVLCIRYESGNWWHYKFCNNQVEWW